MPPRVSITSTFEIAAAHHLPHHRGKCHRLHGHNYRLEFTRYGTPKPVQMLLLEARTRSHALVGETWVPAETQDSDVGMVMDFADFDGAIKAVLGLLDDDGLDHRCLNDTVGLDNPTAEHLALWLLERLPLVDRVVVWETGRHCAAAERERGRRR